MLVIAEATGGESPWEAPIRLIMKGGVVPHDALHVTALLEMGGWNDKRANTEFGFDDLFEMGEELYRQIRTRVATKTFAGPDPYPWYKWLWMGFQYYLRGLMFAMPMVISIVAMLILKYSLWSDEKFGPEDATAIAIGTMSSFLATGGFTQAVARRGLFYISQKEYALARKSSLRLLMAGVVAALGVAAFFTLINFVVPFFPWRLIRFAVPYYLFLCLLWLSITILYMMREELLFTAITGAGIGVVWYLHSRLEWGIVRAQMVGLGMATAISMGLALWLFWRQERRTETGTGEAQMPRWSQVSRLLVPYFLFGTLYFGFLFLDRLIAWSVPAETHPLPIWFDGPYELGLDWAILTLISPLGLCELFINLFAARLTFWQAASLGSEWRDFNQRFQKTYLIQLASLGLISALGGWLLWLFFARFHAFGLLDVALFQNVVTNKVYIVGTIAYVFLSIGLMNCLMLFSLNYPWPAVQSMGLAVLVDLLVGFILSRVLEYGDAVYGLLMGAIVFAVFSTVEVYKNLGRLDYMLFRSV